VLFSGNHGGNGAAFNLSGSSSASLRNLTISGNRSAGTSGGILFDSSGALQVVNSVLWNNSDSSGTGTAAASLSVSGTGTTTMRRSLWQGSGGSAAWSVATVVNGGDNLDTDPRFRSPLSPTTTPSVAGDLHLRYVSPAIDAGDLLTATLGADLDANVRVQGANIDLGPYEGAAAEADVIAAFDPVSGTPIAGSSQSFLLRITNPATAAASGITVSDDFPALLDCAWTASAAGGASGQSAGSGDLLQTLSLPVGASITYAIDCAIDSAATGLLTHTATASVGAEDYDAANNVSAISLPIVRVADLFVTIDDGLTQVAPGDEITYTVVVGNAGPSDAIDASVAATFSPTLAGCNWQCVAANGASCAPGDGTGDVADIVDLPAAASITYTAQCSVPAGISFDTISSTATIAVPAGATGCHR
jgi:uncharacterized repeat protein (TIGR01451 family)